jgi:hypothetical protein
VKPNDGGKMARINVKKLVAFKAVHDHGKKDAWFHCYFDLMVLYI